VRSYVSGGTPATGVGDPGGDAAAPFLRSGMLWSGEPGHSLELAVGLERYRITVDPHTEAASASNPFPASFGPTSIYGTRAKVSMSLARPLGAKGDATLGLGIGRAWFSGNVAGTVSGVSFADSAQDTTFAQLMLRAGWLADGRSRLDAFVTSTAGSHLKTHSSAGLSWTWLF
jgi:hypothetical protein